MLLFCIFHNNKTTLYLRFIFQGISAISTYTNFRLILLILLTSIGFTNFSSGQNDHTRNSEKEIYKWFKDVGFDEIEVTTYGDFFVRGVGINKK